jgi:hypothetical protein
LEAEKEPAKAFMGKNIANVGQPFDLFQKFSPSNSSKFL